MSRHLIRAGALLGVAATLLGGAGPASGQPLPAVLSQPALATPRAACPAAGRGGRRLVAVGERGIVLLSDDAGNSWRQAATVPVSVTLTAVRFASPTEGWAVGNLGVILRSEDGGETWERKLDGQRAALIMHEAADRLPPGDVRTTALRDADQLVTDGPDKPFLDLMVADLTVVAIGACGLAIRSDDGGQTWRAALEIPDPRAPHLYGIARVAGTTVIAGEQGFLAVGRSGQFRVVPTANGGTFFGVAAVPGGFLAFGLGGALLRSDDQGETWTSLASGQTGGIMSAVTLPDGRVLLGSDSGELALSDAEGKHFRPSAPMPHVPITDMVVDRDTLILTGPGGPRRVALGLLGGAS
jgi:photosystem II stability/assembly factor-like uncharacterized protein